MNTERIVLDQHNFDAALDHAADIIRRGGLVAFPTETVYGLGANALDAEAAAKIFAAKQRALNDPLIVHVATADIAQLVPPSGINERVSLLIRTFWAGALTLVLPKSNGVPPIVTAGGDKVAVRMPNHAVARALIQKSGVPIAAPSANLFGHISPTTAQHVLDDLDGRIDLVLDGGATEIGVESTVLDMTTDPPKMLRPGGITRQQIEAVLGMQLFANNHQLATSNQPLDSPGMLEKHYAPNAKLVICKDTRDLVQTFGTLVRQFPTSVIGLLLMSHEQSHFKNHVPVFGLGADLTHVAKNLYAGLRALDSANSETILVSAVAPIGIGEAIADRLKRAAAR